MEVPNEDPLRLHSSLRAGVLWDGLALVPPSTRRTHPRTGVLLRLSYALTVRYQLVDENSEQGDSDQRPPTLEVPAKKCPVPVPFD